MTSNIPGIISQQFQFTRIKKHFITLHNNEFYYTEKAIRLNKLQIIHSKNLIFLISNLFQININTVNLFFRNDLNILIFS